MAAARRSLSLLLLVAALLASGCVDRALDAAPASVGASSPIGPGLGFGPGVLATTGCANGCFEPTVAVDGAGRIYATGAVGTELGVSTDGGASFAPLAAPPLPPGAPEGGIGSDVLLQTSPSGRLYYSALVRAPLPGATAVTLLQGLWVASSEDGGATWPVNVYLSALAQPGVHVYAPDRQWLGFGPGEVVYMAYNQLPTGIWVARSDDGGRTWGDWVDAADAASRQGGLGQASPPVVDRDGRVYLAATSGAGGLLVFRSDDGGATWDTTEVHAAGVDDSAAWFPIVAVAPEASVHVAYWWGGDILTASSDDRGETWSDPVRWGGHALVSPWLVATGADELAVAWYESDGAGARLRFARGPPAEGPHGSVVVASGIAGGKVAHTDFAHFALLPDGRAVVTWATDEAGEAFVAIEGGGGLSPPAS